MKSDQLRGNRIAYRGVIFDLALVVWAVGAVLSTGVRADDLSCKIVRDAMLAMTVVKYNAKIVTTVTGRAPIKNEEIYTVDATYHQVLQRWIKMPTSPAREWGRRTSMQALPGAGL